VGKTLRFAAGSAISRSMREWGRVVATTFHPEARHADGHEDTKVEAMEANNGVRNG
jgi:hypothetical protein